MRQALPLPEVRQGGILHFIQLQVGHPISLTNMSELTHLCNVAYLLVLERCLE
jgi:hypothetical protein